MPVPKLRSLDLVAGQWNGQQAVVPRDYEGLLETPVLLPLPVFLVAFFLDRRREALDVQIEYARLTGGQILPRVDLDRIIADLDAHHLLETPRQALGAAYRAAPHRPAAHAGASYPGEAAALRAALQGILDGAQAPVADGGRPVRGVLALGFAACGLDGVTTSDG